MTIWIKRRKNDIWQLIHTWEIAVEKIYSAINKTLSN